VTDLGRQLFSFSVALTAALLNLGCTLPPAAPAPPPLLAAVPSPMGMAVDWTTVYVARRAQAPVLAVDITHGTVTPVGVEGGAGAIAVDVHDLYWTDDSGVYACDKSNCPGTRITLAGDAATDIAIDSDNVYWSVQNPAGPGRIMKVGKTGGAPSQVVEFGSPRRLAVDGQYVYWIDAIGVLAVPIEGGAPMQLAVLAAPDTTALALGQDLVYFLTAQGQLFQVSKSGGTGKVLLSDLGDSPTGLAVDGQNLYVTGSEMLLKMPAGGGPVYTLAAPLDQPARIILDPQNVYAADEASGIIVKVPKQP